MLERIKRFKEENYQKIFGIKKYHRLRKAGSLPCLKEGACLGH
ncbi:hypothetical protein HMPREF1552_00286 [Leptotrichia sp. oral taxon 879 str. F0557]|nr:hypothetical protein HMPREF1552_00286 [Leptotrichia sp. oral taxon 879 str. F0557]